MEKQERLEFINLLEVSSGRGASRGGVLHEGFVGVGGTELVGLASEVFRAGGLEIRAAMFAIDGAAIHIIAGTRVAWRGSVLWNSGNPANASVAFPHSAELLKESAAQTPARQKPAPVPVAARRPALLAHTGAEVSAMHVTSDGAVVGDKNGYVHTFDSAGKLQSKFRGQGPVSVVRRLPNGGIVFGCRDTSLALARLDGVVQWRKEFGAGIRQRLRVPSALLEWGEDLLAGMEDETMFRLRADGTEVWSTLVQYHAITNLALARIKGADHIVVGTEYYAIDLFRADGTQLWRRLQGPATAVAAFDLDGNGDDEILYADWASLHAVRSDSSVAWSVNLGGEVLGVRVLAGAGRSPSIITASDVGQVAALTLDGEPLWRLDAGEPLTSMAATENTLALGCLSGAVQIRDAANGRLRETLHVESPVLRLAEAPRLPRAFFGATESGMVFRADA